MPISPGFGSPAVGLNALLSGVGQRVVPISPRFGSRAVELNALLSGVG